MVCADASNTWPRSHSSHRSATNGVCASASVSSGLVHAFGGGVCGVLVESESETTRRSARGGQLQAGGSLPHAAEGLHHVHVGVRGDDELLGSQATGVAASNAGAAADELELGDQTRGALTVGALKEALELSRSANRSLERLQELQQQLALVGTIIALPGAPYHACSECLLEQLEVHKCVSADLARLSSVRARGATIVRSSGSGEPGDAHAPVTAQRDSSPEAAAAAAAPPPQCTSPSSGSDTTASTGTCAEANAAAERLVSSSSQAPVASELLDAVWTTIEARLAHLQAELAALQLVPTAQATRDGTSARIQSLTRVRA